MRSFYVKFLFIFIVVVILGISLITHRNLTGYTKEVVAIRHSNLIIRVAQSVLSIVKDAETGQRGFLITQDSVFLQPYHSALSELPGQLNLLDSLVANNSHQKRNVDSLRSLIKNRLLIMSTTLAETRDDAFRKKYQLTERLLIGKATMDKVREATRATVDYEAAIVQQGIDDESEYKNVTPIALLFYTLFALFGITFMFIKILRELSKREMAERVVKEDFKKLQAQNILMEERRIILNEAEAISKMGSWKWEENSNEVIGSDGLYKILNRKTDEPISLHAFLENVHSEDVEELKIFLDKIKTSEIITSIDYRIVTGNKVRYFSMMAKPTTTTTTTTTTILGAVVEITERKEYERLLEQSNQELKRSNEDLEQFASVASHDLQEPLRKIRAFGDRLISKYGITLGELGSDYIFRMQSAATRMQLLIQNLLTFSKASRLEVDYQLLQPVSILEEVLDDIEVLVKQELAVVHIGKIPAFTGDKLQVKRLFQNLIANAIKFHKAGVPPHVEIQGRQMQEYEILKELGLAVPQNEYVRISIKDNGIGFDNKYAEQIFTIFQRLHGHTAYEGTGIGLAICRKIVANHDGYILAKGTEGVGSEFIVIFKINSTGAK